jgi:membrane protein implicated in regulation of membrane protease activity
VSGARVETVVRDCVRYWTETGVPRPAVAEMEVELTEHLRTAVDEGRSPDDVIGSDVAAFAEHWAVEHRATTLRTPSWDDVISGRTGRARARRRELAGYGAGLVTLVVAAAVAGKGEVSMEDEIWRWLWTGLAVVMGIGEIFTAGFFLLPFSVGAAAAAVLAWVGANVLSQWLVFFGVSAVSFAYLRRYIARQDEEMQPRVGANRWVGSRGIVLEEIDPDTATGMVRVHSEEWRATSLSGAIIPPGSRITVHEVSGSRLVVEPYEES